jgi:hypothetical protein
MQGTSFTLLRVACLKKNCCQLDCDRDPGWSDCPRGRIEWLKALKYLLLTKTPYPQVAEVKG